MKPKCFISAIVIASLLPCLSWAYTGGTGEPNDPYLIYDANQMNAIGADPCDWDKHFKLMADIDLSRFTGTDFNIIGYWDERGPNEPFTGVFDGTGHHPQDVGGGLHLQPVRQAKGRAGKPGNPVQQRHPAAAGCVQGNRFPG